MATTHPDLAKEWHLIKNQGLTPQQVFKGSNKKCGGNVKKVMSGKLKSVIVPMEQDALCVEEINNRRQKKKVGFLY